MVKKIISFFSDLGQFRRGYIRRRRFLRALRRCERLNRTDARKHIVVNLGGRPLILCKADFRELRLQGVFHREVTWSMLVQRCVTLEKL